MKSREQELAEKHFPQRYEMSIDQKSAVPVPRERDKEYQQCLAALREQREESYRVLCWMCRDGFEVNGDRHVYAEQYTGILRKPKCKAALLRAMEHTGNGTNG